ncbi:hypothetical protein [Nocardia macrotermitis]|uniref:Uncharacterized protein n=1 Tax=Nocardia macrotermitis TaxID=2585198 RepID=A0A7K0DDU1_9NOCA|nr:hypothetical protein [Nocardia macrotermitis]MQY23838.1 hypothetical protein [Nocardia macrotermitis]
MADLPDKGQKDAQAAYAAAKAGHFVMPVDSAKRLAAASDKLIAGLEDEIDASDPLIHVTGFPDLPSGRALAQGFGAKGQEYITTLKALKLVTMQNKAAWLAAGKLVEADAANAAALKFSAQALEGNA